MTLMLFKCNKIEYVNFKTKGMPFVHVARKAKGIKMGCNFRMNNSLSGNPIGFRDRCSFVVHNDAEIIIGNNVGISQATLVSHSSIIIEDYVDIGGGVKIYTSDFHSINPETRKSANDQSDMRIAPVHICESAFIGAGSIILKGTTIGRNSIVGAGSVVTKSIPDNQIWAGNPAHFIKNIQ